MKKRNSILVAFLAFSLSFTLAFAEHHTAEERGKAHFNNSSFANGTKPCSTCHPDGKRLENAGAKTNFTIMGGKQESLEEAVNVCIVNANRGKTIDVKSTEMQEVVSYIKSLGAKTAPGYGK